MRDKNEPNAPNVHRTTVKQPPRAGSRSVAGVFRSAEFHWVGDGFFVSSYFPRADLPAERVSPFLLMDYGPPREFAALAKGRRGVGWHPHRGFETVTLAWEGAVAHNDNLGNAGVIGPGDVMRAIDNADVRAAIAAAPVLYGNDPRPADGQVMRIEIGSAIIEVGGACRAVDCKPVPAGVSSLAEMLKAVTKQQLSRSPCNMTFPPPP